MTVGLVVHVLAAIVWVGGMFFAYVVLRPVAGTMEPPARLALWRGVFGKFFPWVWVAVLALPISGYAMIFLGLGGFAGAGLHVHLMHALGLVMIALFVFLYYRPWPRLRAALDGNDLPGAAGELATIRKIVATNLVLGLLTSAIGASGRYWG